MVDTELAWELAETARGHLDARQRNQVYVAIAAGDAFWVTTFLLQKIVRSGLAIRSDTLPNLLRWVGSYRDHPEHGRLRDLIERVTVEPFDPPREVTPPPTILTTSARYKQPVRRVPGKVRNLRTAVRRDARSDLRLSSNRAPLLNNGIR